MEGGWNATFSILVRRHHSLLLNPAHTEVQLTNPDYARVLPHSLEFFVVSAEPPCALLSDR